MEKAAKKPAPEAPARALSKLSDAEVTFLWASAKEQEDEGAKMAAHFRAELERRKLPIGYRDESLSIARASKVVGTKNVRVLPDAALKRLLEEQGLLQDSFVREPSIEVLEGWAASGNERVARLLAKHTEDVPRWEQVRKKAPA